MSVTSGTGCPLSQSRISADLERRRNISFDGPIIHKSSLKSISCLISDVFMYFIAFCGQIHSTKEKCLKMVSANKFVN